MMKAFQARLREPANPPDVATHRDIVQAGGASNMYNQDRAFMRNPAPNPNCYYCQKPDHMARDCTIKHDHISKGWISFEGGKQFLGNGNPIPSGRTPTAQRVEEFYRRLSSNMVAEVYYTGDGPSEIDNVMDELKTLRVKFNQLAGGPAVQPAYMAPVSILVQHVNHAAVQPAPQFTQEDFSRMMYNFMNSRGEGGNTQDQFVQTRSGKQSAPSDNQGF
ncbi:hypothetical protein C8F01DRAFT_1094905 [Mycena amicta]|nr:hypothetical protein C8F01DRAFT_1094905 [Mycena amicta]